MLIRTGAGIRRERRGSPHDLLGDARMAGRRPEPAVIAQPIAPKRRRRSPSGSASGSRPGPGPATAPDHGPAPPTQRPSHVVAASPTSPPVVAGFARPTRLADHHCVAVSPPPDAPPAERATASDALSDRLGRSYASSRCPAPVSDSIRRSRDGVPETRCSPASADHPHRARLTRPNCARTTPPPSPRVEHQNRPSRQVEHPAHPTRSADAATALMTDLPSSGRVISIPSLRCQAQHNALAIACPLPYHRSARCFQRQQRRHV